MWKKLAETAAKEALQDKNVCSCFTTPSGEKHTCVFHAILEALHGKFCTCLYEKNGDDMSLDPDCPVHGKQ